MNKKIGRQTVRFENPPVIKSTFSTVGKKEGEGPYGTYFDEIIEDEFIGQKTWEQGESELLKQTVTGAAKKCALSFSDADYIFAGDLLNQCISSSFGIKVFDVPFFGLFGACSTFGEGMSLGAMMIDGGFAKNVICATSSHFCGAEKQFRYPVEYGSARTPTSQWTVTGSGAAVISNEGEGPKITHITTGKVVDLGVTDANNMGAAMAPAAADVIYAHFSETKRSPDYYDMIITGDLAAVGTKLCKDLLLEKGLDISKNYNDCGYMIFNHKEQSVKSGGSGCGCCSSMFCSYFYKRLCDKEINRLLFVPTGALLSQISASQGATIPSIAHAIAIENL